MRADRLAAAVALALTGAAATPAAAQRIGTIEAGVHAQRTFFSDRLALEDRFGGGGLLGVFVLPNLELIGEMTFTPTTGPVNGDILHRPMYARLQYNLPVADRLRLMAGAGIGQTIYGGDVTANKYEDGFHALGGVRYYLDPSWSLRVEGIWDRLPHRGAEPERPVQKGGYNNIGARIGLSWQYPPNDQCVVTIEPTTTTLRAGESRTFRVTALGERSGRDWKGARPTFTSDDGAITPNGVYTPRTPGAHTVTATVRGGGCTGTASANVTVSSLEAIAIAPKTATVDAGGATRFSVRGRMSDGGDSTGLAVRYGSSCGTIDAAGNFRAGAQAGSCTVTATVTTADGRTLTDDASVTVNAPPPPPPPPSPVRLVSTVHFDLGKSALDAEARRTLDAVIDSLKSASGPIHIAGHADTIPPAGARSAQQSKRFNDQLSQRRVDAVARYLASRGIPRARVVSHAFGFCKPAVPSVSPAQQPKGERQNRRAEVSIQLDPEANLVNVCSER